MRKLVLHMREARTEGDMLLHMQVWIPCTASMVAGPNGPVGPRKLVLRMRRARAETHLHLYILILETKGVDGWMRVHNDIQAI
jgi:hypothetical protein